MKKVNLCSLAQAEQERTKAGFKIILSTNPENPFASCGCGCYWANQGGSSEDNNARANAIGYLWSKPPS